MRWSAFFMRIGRPMVASSICMSVEKELPVRPRNYLVVGKRYPGKPQCTYIFAGTNSLITMKKIIFAAFCLGLAFTGCKKDEPESNNNNNGGGGGGDNNVPTAFHINFTHAGQDYSFVVTDGWDPQATQGYNTSEGSGDCYDYDGSIYTEDENDLEMSVVRYDLCVEPWDCDAIVAAFTEGPQEFAFEGNPGFGIRMWDPTGEGASLSTYYTPQPESSSLNFTGVTVTESLFGTSIDYKGTFTCVLSTEDGLNTFPITDGTFRLAYTCD